MDSKRVWCLLRQYTQLLDRSLGDLAALQTRGRARRSRPSVQPVDIQLTGIRDVHKPSRPSSPRNMIESRAGLILPAPLAQLPLVGEILKLVWERVEGLREVDTTGSFDEPPTLP